jgi:hypothetical protein
MLSILRIGLSVLVVVLSHVGVVALLGNHQRVFWDYVLMHAIILACVVLVLSAPKLVALPSKMRLFVGALAGFLVATAGLTNFVQLFHVARSDPSLIFVILTLSMFGAALMLSFLHIPVIEFAVNALLRVARKTA